MELVVHQQGEEFQFAVCLCTSFEFLRIHFIALRCNLSIHFKAVILNFQTCEPYETIERK